MDSEIQPKQNKNILKQHLELTIFEGLSFLASNVHDTPIIVGIKF